MKANAQELRIKNWVRLHVNHSDYNEFQIEIEDLVLMAKSKQHQYSPIPLTEEWLLKFGFEKQKYGNWSNGKLEIGYYSTDECFQYEYISVLFETETRNLEHVHTLQNLYWCLCGEELTIK
jgi:hypothetical protein